ncbi:sensor histidine kinase [Aneurinibacillus uraniidurans]|uniref:sensor histidine kinase n=1 Tax=Aneurinibacillus uraniidurans TaxID=2966586 RepID=UPI0023494F49|nr:sensor histidine kinase [Aneurinibacillus sp. B1]WCN36319.1 sensor histidine kinase [Aneurinibacillus sp. B1]
MVVLLSIIIILLLTINYIQFQSRKAQKRNLARMQEKLSSIVTNHTGEKLLLMTDDKELQLLLVEINRLLENNQKNIAAYHKTEQSIRKMLSNISHDLKTPLTVVLGCIEVMVHSSNVTEEERQKLLVTVHDKAIEVLDMINKFFDLARLESGDKDIQVTRVNISEICKKNILDFYESLTAKGFDVSLEIPEQDIYGMGNEEALGRILANLISNAIRYGNDGRVIGLTLRHDEQHVYIDVWDKGKGIHELHKDRIFERMYTLEDSRNKLYQGSGLGLTITKRLVERLGGTISLVSKPYEKTTFTVQLNKMNYTR